MPTSAPGSKAAANKSLAERASTLWAICVVANARHSFGYGCALRLASHPKPRRAPSRGLIQRRRAPRGFTLLELLVVLAIIAIATAGVSLALRDSQAAVLEREAQRLAALLESARAQSRSSGVPVRWRPTDDGFRFEGVAPGALPDRWLTPGTRAQVAGPLVLGPEPIIGRQEVVLVSGEAPQRSVRIATDGLRPFAIATPSATP
jgi:general secretion pathway protein H